MTNQSRAGLRACADLAARRSRIADPYADAVLAYAHGLAGMTWVESATLAVIDRFGIELVVRAAGRSETTRIQLDTPLRDGAQLWPVLVALARRALQKGS
jgi:putative heme iron utilization protein